MCKEPGGLNEDDYYIKAYPDHMHSLPSNWYDDLCQHCNNLDAEDD